MTQFGMTSLALHPHTLRFPGRLVKVRVAHTYTVVKGEVGSKDYLKTIKIHLHFLTILVETAFMNGM